jgi:hypothetical protein
MSPRLALAVAADLGRDIRRLAAATLAPPAWAQLRVQQPWFPAELRFQRADALVRAPASFRKHGVYLSAADLEAM